MAGPRHALTFCQHVKGQSQARHGSACRYSYLDFIYFIFSSQDTRYRRHSLAAAENIAFTIKPRPPGAMQLRQRGHNFILPNINMNLTSIILLLVRFN